MKRRSPGIGGIMPCAVALPLAAVDVPDFTRGAWREKRPLPDFDVDFASMGRKS